ncbi:hypothetical protein LOZ80_15080 [Paenibacillus sp. HWE-109]|uniref:hypothetical protein n=1 Tax=Paenibacillus sp. HWE-109 TaxID=1306526 RepID=UPI001EE0DF94|nr:hypothetical protein [Paenibacillus sp. HWE-109]UKS30184.1 hypothetical protein LOZ80_15080 [Paenibacillus sp. HWE-109]
MSGQITVIDGVKYREVSRKADVGERIKVTGDGSGYYKIGDLAEVIRESSVDVYANLRRSETFHGDGYWYVRHEHYVVLEPLTCTEPSADIRAQIDGLTQTVASLTLRVTELERKQSAKFSVLAKQLDDAMRAPFKTRDGIVEQAKKDVAELERSSRDVSGKTISFWPKVIDGIMDWIPMQRVEYVINREKRTVVALIKYLPNFNDGEIYARGKARCAPDDCFNAHIGKAIALRRALGLTVPDEYINVPQPESVCVGDIVDTYDGDREFHMRITVRGVETDSDGEIQLDHAGCDGKGYTYTSFDVEYGDRIIDDSREEVSA